MAYIYERYPGKWYIKFQHENKRYQRFAGTTKKEAQAFQKQLQDQLILDKLQKSGIIQLYPTAPKKDEKPAMLFSELAHHYLEHCKTKAAATLRSETHRITGHFLPAFGHYRLDEVTPDKVEKWKQMRLRKGITNTTLHNDMRTLKTMFNRANEWGYYDGKNPVGNLPKLFNRKMTFLTTQNVQDFLAACPPYYYPIAATLICTGMRSGEMRNLKWTDLDFDTRTIHIPSTASLKNEEDRTIPMFPELIPILQALPRTSKYVFPGEDSVSKRSINFRRGHQIARRTIGMPGLRIHDLRHTFVTLLLEKGFDIASVAKLVGHKNLKITLNIYHHLHQEHARKIIDGLPVKLDTNWAPPVPKTVSHPVSARKETDARTKRETTPPRTPVKLSKRRRRVGRRSGI